VLETIEAWKKVKAKAEIGVMDDLQEKVNKVENSILNMEEKVRKKEKFWNKTKLDELKEHIEDLQDKKETFLKLLNGENEKGLKEMMSRKYKKEIVEKRVGIRKSSSGRPQQLDQEDEEFILNCIESKSRAHGRRMAIRIIELKRKIS
jgi:hypothetical protein